MERRTMDNEQTHQEEIVVPAPDNPTLGLAMIAQNESLHIPPTIAQFYHYVDDIVVVDGGSTDDTVNWCERMGARVVHRSFDHDFSAQKNFAIEQLNTDWVYLHDPDERLEPPLLEILKVLISKQGQVFLMRADVIPGNTEFYDCYGLPRRNFLDGVQTEIYPDYQYRLFKNYCRFEGKVHEKIVGFKHRTEVDYKRPVAARPQGKKETDTISTERGQIETKVDILDRAQVARFNILQYKSSTKQQEQDEMYRQIRERES
jgi:glycosyltransferase involved in cell wall biosynthesis